VRIFAALPLPAEIQKAIHVWMSGWGSGQTGLKLVEEENLHITLVFFGELPLKSVEELQRLLGAFRFPCIPAALGKAGSFPPGGSPRVYYVDLETGGERVVLLQKKLVDAVSAVDYQRDRRDFKPHITCARVKKRGASGRLPAAEELQARSLQNLGFEFSSVVLFESRLSSSGPTYLPLTIVGLEPAG